MWRLGANALGEVLVPGRVADCYLGLRLAPAGDAQVAGVLVVAPAALLHPVVPQPEGIVLYELLTGHPDRTAQELVFLADLALELRAWPADTWSKVGVDPQAAAGVATAGPATAPAAADSWLGWERLAGRGWWWTPVVRTAGHLELRPRPQLTLRQGAAGGCCHRRPGARTGWAREDRRLLGRRPRLG